jgi:hypothetical protein
MLDWKIRKGVISIAVICLVFLLLEGILVVTCYLVYRQVYLSCI